MFSDDIRNGALSSLLLFMLAGLVVMVIVLGLSTGRGGEPRRVDMRLQRLPPSLAVGLGAGAAVLPLVILFLGPGAGVAFAICVAVLVGLGRWLTGRSGEQAAPSPQAVLRRDRTTLLSTAAAAALVSLLALFPFSGSDVAVVVAVAAAAVAALGTGSPWLSYTAVCLWLAARGDLPWRLMRFLRREHAAGVLRQVGPVYQFRHDLLRGHLAAHAPTRAPRWWRPGRRSTSAVRWTRRLHPVAVVLALIPLPVTLAALPKAYEASLRGHTGAVFHLAFTPDGTLVSAALDGTVRLWDPATGRARRTLHVTALRDNRFGVSISADGRTLAADATGWDYGSQPRTRVLGLWDTATGHRREITVPGVGFQSVHAMAFSPDGSVLAVTDTDRVRLLDVATGRQRGSIPCEDASAVAFRPGTAVLATAGPNGVQMWDTTTGALQLSTPADFVTELVFSPDGFTLAGASFGEEGVLWPLSPAIGRALQPVLWTLPVWSLAFDPHGLTLITGESNGQIRDRDPATGRTRSTRTVDVLSVDALAVSPTGTILATAGTAGPVRLWSRTQQPGS